MDFQFVSSQHFGIRLLHHKIVSICDATIYRLWHPVLHCDGGIDLRGTSYFGASQHLDGGLDVVDRVALDAIPLLTCHRSALGRKHVFERNLVVAVLFLVLVVAHTEFDVQRGLL